MATLCSKIYIYKGISVDCDGRGAQTPHLGFKNLCQALCYLANNYIYYKIKYIN